VRCPVRHSPYSTVSAWNANASDMARLWNTKNRKRAATATANERGARNTSTPETTIPPAPT